VLALRFLENTIRIAVVFELLKHMTSSGITRLGGYWRNIDQKESVAKAFLNPFTIACQGFSTTLH
jgi:hypothetical protein